ncbi:MAG: LapA family protein [Alphaproteobacteria bacterium]
MKVLYWIVVALAALALALFAASNRAPVSLGFWPFGFALELPLYLAILLTFFAGLLCGALAAWAGGRHWRREARLRRRSMTALKSELEATQAQMAGPAPPAATAPRSGAGTAPSSQVLVERPPSVPARG